MIDGLQDYPAYRESGLPWLGRVPAHWSVRRLKTVFREVDRRSGTGAEPLLSLRMRQGLIDHHEAGGKSIPPSVVTHYKVAAPGEIVMNRMRAAAGLFGVPPKVGLVSPDYAVLRPRHAVELSYFIHLFRTPRMMGEFRLESRGLGTGESGFLRLYTERFGMIAAPVPPSEEQAAIVRFLDHADRRIRRYIRAKQRLIELLEEQKQAIIHQAVTRGIDPNVRLKPSGVEWLGEIPEHWEIQRAKAVCEAIIDCKNRTPPFVEDGTHLVVRTTCVRNQSFDPSGGYPTDEASFATWTARGAPRRGDVFFTREAPAGEAALVPPRVDLCMGQRMMYFRPSPALLHPRFLLLNIYGPLSRTYVQQVTNGSTVGHLRLGQVYALPILWCPEAEQTQIVAYVETESQMLDSALANAMREIALLRELHTRLIADVVTGQLDVREAAARLPDLPLETDTVEADDELDDEASDDEADAEEEEAA